MAERVRTLVALAVIGISLGIIAAALGADDPDDPDRVRSLASRLQCPMCDNESIADSPTAIARDLYTLIAEQVAAGMSDDEIVDFFVATYGEQVLLDPPLDARTIALWLVPAAGAAAGIAVIASRRSRVRTRELTEEERHRLESELRDRQGA
jgi:cytochrome c-type biogenesis protein CcmH